MKKFSFFISVIALVFAACSDNGNNPEAPDLTNGEIYASLSSDQKTMTLYYGTQKNTDDVTDWSIYRSHDGIHETGYHITTVVLDESMKKARPTSTKEWFYDFWDLAEFQHLDYLNTSKVTDMSWMFAKTVVTSLELYNFDTQKVTDMSYMFYVCDELKCIFCDNDWSTSPNLTTSKDMFLACSKLKGGNGTECDGVNNVKASYAKLDEEGKPGYFTKYLREIYGVLASDEVTVTVYYDHKKALRDGTTNWMAAFNYVWSGWYKVKTIILDESMKEARPMSTRQWFYGFTYLTEIRHLDYLNTSEVTDMSSMFERCESLTSLNLSLFNTQKVENMGSMFSECKALTSLDVSHFNTANVTNMPLMFAECEALTSLDLRSFNVDKVESMKSMFYECTGLKTIYCNEDWTNKKVTPQNSYNMFMSCAALTGGNGTKYSDFNTSNIAFARPDKAGSPGYFTRLNASN